MATTAPFSNLDPAFDTINLAIAAGATFVARTTTYHFKEIKEFIKKAILHKGFSVVEILSQCPTYFGRKNKMGDPVEMLKFFKQNTALLGSKKLQENPDLIARGIFADKKAPEYTEEYQKLIQKVKKD
jgi:2-oxoglutarate ferredoxin oxidoreductase subunit beta